MLVSTPRCSQTVARAIHQSQSDQICWAGLFWRGLLVVAFLALGIADPAWADDRTLLRAEGAPANVLIVLDSGASMTHDPETNSLNFLAAGDDDGRYLDFMKQEYGESYLTSILGAEYEAALERGAKLPQAKNALQTFFNAGFEFNYGFSFYEKTDISINYLNFIYRVKEVVERDGESVAQGSMLNGTEPGMPLRFGADDDMRNSGAATPRFPIRYGANGDEVYIEDPDPLGTNQGSEKKGPIEGDVRLASFLVNSARVNSAEALADLTATERRTQNMYYYPAYFWGSSGLSDGVSWGRHVRMGLRGSESWQEVAEYNGINTADPNWPRVLHDYVLEDITMQGDPWSSGLGTLSNSNQIGSRTLYIMEMYQEYLNDNLGWSHVAPGTSPQITEVEYVQHFALYDHDPAEENPGAGTLSALDYQGTADCAGYLDDGGDPIVPMSVPDPDSGATSDQSWMIESYLKPQTEPVFYFPDTDEKYLPRLRNDYIPMTETIAAIGRRPIKDTINEAKSYFNQTVADWDDPLANCRMNFMILITDGIETCSNTTAPCSAASNIAPIPVYVIYFGTEDNALNPNLSVVECVADNSGGLYFQAGNQIELTRALMRIATDIEERTRGFASPIVPSVETSSKQATYIATFTPREDRSIWRGHLRAYPIDPVTGLIAGLRVDGSPNPLTADWDAGDALALRDSGTRKMFFGMNAQGTEQPGSSQAFVYQGGGSEDELLHRFWLGERIFDPNSWLETDPLTGELVESETKKQDLQDVINFMRGVEMERDPFEPNTITQFGRDPDTYGWCEVTGDEVDGSTNPCESNGATLLGIEKLGDIFHSTPQLMAAPKCYPCFLRNLWGYRDDTSTEIEDDGFYFDHRRRRQVIITGADDGALHAFDAGLWDPDGGLLDGRQEGPMYDRGTGRELFAWIPNGVMSSFDDLAYLPSHSWTVDGTPTVADVYIDPEFSGAPIAAEREWRTVVVFGNRRGGHSYVALDVTKPDPYGVNGEPLSPAIGDVGLDSEMAAQSSDRDAICSTAGVDGCDHQWPEFKWEFEDLDAFGLPRDEDNNGQADLGQTWSRPLVGFVKVDADGDPLTDPEPKMIAIFGGGLAEGGMSAFALSGNFVYGVDIETGQILFKIESAGMVPAAVSALDEDLNGFLETLYWSDTAGYLYRMDISTVGVLGDVMVNGEDEARVVNWNPTVLFQAPPGQPFFMRPTIAAAAEGGDGTPIYALAIGSGNRDDILEANPIAHRFYVVMDKTKSDGTPITEADLRPCDYEQDAPDGSNFLSGDADFGWYLPLDDVWGEEEAWEKVNTAAIVLAGAVVFSTFNPSSEVEEVPIYDDERNIIGWACRRGGNARTYIVSLGNGNPMDGDSRYVQHGSGTAIVSEPIVYLGADGKVHVIQALDNLTIDQPVEPLTVGVRTTQWKQH